MLQYIRFKLKTEPRDYSAKKRKTAQHWKGYVQGTSKITIKRQEHRIRSMKHKETRDKKKAEQ
jgi:hypothetical protein